MQLISILTLQNPQKINVVFQYSSQYFYSAIDNIFATLFALFLKHSLQYFHNKVRSILQYQLQNF